MDKIKISFNKPRISTNIIKLRNTINTIYNSIDFNDIIINYNKMCIKNEQNISIYNIFRFLYDNNLLSNSLNSYSLDKQNEFKLPDFENIDIELGLRHLANNKKLYIKILNDFSGDLVSS